MTGRPYAYPDRPPPYSDVEQANYGYYDQSRGYNLADVFTYDETELRNHFVRRVFLILALMMLSTFLIVIGCLTIEPLKAWILEHLWIAYVAMGFYMFTYIIIVCCPIRGLFPWNYICLFVTTISCSFMVGCITVVYKTHVVLIAFGITAAVCLVITFLAFSSFDFTKFYVYLVALGAVAAIFGLVVTLVFVFISYIKILSVVYSAIMALIMCCFMLMEMQMILGGRSLELSEEEYIGGALMMYVSIISIFLHILNLVGAVDG